MQEQPRLLPMHTRLRSATGWGALFALSVLLLITPVWYFGVVLYALSAYKFIDTLGEFYFLGRHDDEA